MHSLSLAVGSGVSAIRTRVVRSALASHAERDDGLHERGPDAHDVGFTLADNAVE